MEDHRDETPVGASHTRRSVLATAGILSSVTWNRGGGDSTPATMGHPGLDHTPPPTQADDENTMPAQIADSVPGGLAGVLAGTGGVLGVYGLYRYYSRGSKRANQSAPVENQTTDEPAATESDATDAEQPAEQEVIFSDIEILDPIGRGLLTQVQDGRLTTDGRAVAVETLAGSPGHMLRDGAFEQFSEGVDTWSSIDDHPNVATVVATGTSPYPWAAIERCESPLTPDAVAELSATEIVELVIDILDAVHEGHEAGMYHGALTPTNVMLLDGVDAPDGATPVVSDWLVSANHLDPELDVADAYPQAAAPEQVDPSRYREPDALVDIYQIGVLTYRLLTGTQPFADRPPGEHEKGDELTPVSELNDDVPSLLDNMLPLALAANPDERYQNALYFRDALKRVVNML